MPRFCGFFKNIILEQFSLIHSVREKDTDAASLHRVTVENYYFDLIHQSHLQKGQTISHTSCAPIVVCQNPLKERRFVTTIFILFISTLSK